MYIQLKNIGIIEDSSIKIQGLTVITGKNDSGKTTVGKTVYAVVDGASDIDEKSEYDEISLMLDALTSIRNNLRSIRSIFRDEGDRSRHLERTYPAFTATINNVPFPATTSKEYYHFCQELDGELSVLLEDTETLSQLNAFIRRWSPHYKSDIAARLHAAQEDVRNAITRVDGNQDLRVYTLENINQTLRKEFLCQIQPVSRQVTASEIIIKDDNGHDELCDLKIVNNQIVTDEDSSFFSYLPYRRAYLLDDPLILDNNAFITDLFPHSYFEGGQTFINNGRIQSHKEALMRLLFSDTHQSTLDQQIINDNLKNVFGKLSQEIPGSYSFESDGVSYAKDGHKLQFSNLATGSKTLSILKMLLQKGVSRKDTLLIFDEPESHLHPAWQNLFAELLVLLVQDTGVSIVLTTHSSNFLLALDAYRRKYGVENVTQFYMTDQLENGMVHYREIHEKDLDEIYYDFVKYFSEMKTLRDQFIPLETEDA